MSLLDREAITRGLLAEQLALGTPLHYQLTTRSTNTDALDAGARGAPPGSVFLCDEQTEGRGRQGRSWWSQPYDSLTFSVLLRPRIATHALPRLCLVAGVALRRALQPFLPLSSAPLGIKWPNDLLLEQRKLAGILVESTQTTRSVAPPVVVGMGINVNQTTFPEAEAPRATSLALATGQRHARESILVSVLRELERCLVQFEVTGFADFRSELAEADALHGRAVRVGNESGTAVGIDREGRLLLDTQAGVVPISSGHVELDFDA